LTYSPWAALRALPHLTYISTRLPAGRAWWLPADDGIVLDDRLTRIGRRCALAHELAHADAGDTACADAVLSGRQELRASAKAARWLVTLDGLVDGLLWAQDEHQLAEELDVDVETVRARLASLTDAEKDYIENRLRAAEEDIA